MSSGNLSHSMRANYAEHGVSEYYTKVSKSYRNPHFPGVKACIFEWMNRWWINEKQVKLDKDPITVFDMACGRLDISCPSTFPDWYEQAVQAHKPTSPKHDSISTIRPPVMRPIKAQTQTKPQTVLIVNMPKPTILAADPFTSEAFSERTQMTCAPLSFKGISDGEIPTISKPISPTSEEGEENKEGENTIGDLDSNSQNLDIVICSFALHLIESPSELFSLLWELSTKARWLVVLAPHKKPEIKEGWGWTKWNTESWRSCSIGETQGDILKERTHCRVYRSLNFD
ncbi:conserved fungal [Pyrrhoderma noxium]|uniref:Conserved fungal n=1 Tax=Pyrrhoderma noxium TaxID=2282107 RepID=A0A286UCR7_9AGAM|nr:conserved fungal [Pyrrhoderma noxium]